MPQVFHATIYPLHWVVRHEGAIFIVPAHANGWVKRLPLASMPGSAEPAAACHALILRTVVGIPI